ncbi:MAG: T9SS type A sorting domain-containing protein [Bacteroidales bacterium]|nr:T9SS type A sorting domain-containing protein [Bacteroidales bacterium]
MKKLFTILIVIVTLINVSYAQQCDNITWVTDPVTVTDENAQIILTTTLDCLTYTWTTGDLYIWMWDDVSGTYPNGTWEDSDPAMQMTDNLDGTYSFTFIPTTLNGGTTGVTDIGFLVKADDGTGDNKTPDQHIIIGGSGINVTSEVFTIHPNPSNGVFTLSSEVDFEVMNISGKVVLYGNGNSINLSDFASGMYIVKLSTVEGILIQKLIVE